MSNKLQCTFNTGCFYVILLNLSTVSGVSNDRWSTLELRTSYFSEVSSGWKRNIQTITIIHENNVLFIDLSTSRLRASSELTSGFRR